MFLRALLFCVMAVFMGSFLQAATDAGSHQAIFQVIQDEMILNSATVRSAAISESSTIPDTYSVDMQLNQVAANELQTLTRTGQGKKANIVVNGKIITSSKIVSEIDGSFSIVGLSKKQAHDFVQALNLTNREMAR